MRVSLKPFENAHKENVQKLYLDAGVDAISFYCAVSFCPVVVAYTFCKQVDPENKEVQRRIESVMKFYGIKEVVE
jgi:hypothetical protein